MRLASPLAAVILASCTGPETQIRRLLPELAVAPPVVEFEPTAVLLTSERDLFITNAGRAQLEVGLELNDPSGVFAFVEELSGTLEVPPEETVTLLMRFAPATFQAYEGSLTLTTNDEQQPTVEVPILGEGVHAPLPDIHLPVQTLDFGEVAQDEPPAVMVLEVLNVGDANLQLGEVEQIGSGAFSLTGTDPSYQTLTPDNNRPVVITYAPTNAYGDNATLTFHSDDPDEPEVQVLLLGNGGGDLEYPVAVVDCPALTSPPGFVNLDGSGSYDPEDHTPLTYAWSINSTPPGSGVAELTQPTLSNTDLFIDVAGPYDVQLVVTNAIGTKSSPDKCLIDAVPEDDVHIELTWDTASADLDLHLVENDSDLFEVPGDCSWCNKNPDWAGTGTDDDPRLDLDDRGGYGPENINIRTPAEGRYHVLVHYFEDGGDFAVTATVKVWLNGELTWEGSKVVTRNQVWDAGTVNWPEATFGQNFDPPYAASRRTCN